MQPLHQRRQRHVDRHNDNGIYVLNRRGRKAQMASSDAEGEDVIAQLKRQRMTVVKLEEGFSGEGNAIFSFDGALNQFLGSIGLESLQTDWLASPKPSAEKAAAPASGWAIRLTAPAKSLSSKHCVSQPRA